MPVRQTEFVHLGESLLYDSGYFYFSPLPSFLFSSFSSSLSLSLQWTVTKLVIICSGVTLIKLGVVNENFINVDFLGRFGGSSVILGPHCEDGCVEPLSLCAF